jgi:hypothetical protein
VLSYHLPGELRKTTKTLVKIAAVLVKIQIKYFVHINVEG